MSRKDYKLIAWVLNRWVWNESTRALLFVEFGKVFEENYPNFDADKWYSARRDGGGFERAK